MIWGRDLLIELGLNLELSEHITKADDGPFNGSKTPMVDLGTYIFKDMNTWKITPEESFTNSYVKEVHESDHVRTTKKWLREILYADC